MITRNSDQELTRQLVEAERQLANLRARNSELAAAIEQTKAASVRYQVPSSILESITDAFVAMDREFRYVWINSEAERLMRVPREHAMGRSMLEVFPVLTGSTLHETCRRALETRQPQECEFYFPPYDTWFLDNVYPTSEGGLAIYWRDVGEQKRNEADLRRQASVLSQVHDAIITTDLGGMITGWNRGARNIFGYTEEEATGRHVSLLYFPEERKRLTQDVVEPLLSKGELEVEMRSQRRSGAECHIRLSLSLLRSETGQAYGILGVSTDITVQQRAERALQESEERYRSLADAMPQIAYVTDTQGKTLFVNGHWREYSGVADTESLGLAWLAAVHPDDAPSHFAQWRECLQRGVSFEHEYRLRNAKAEYRWHLARAVPVRNENGGILKWVGTATDIHNRKMAEDALRASEIMLRKTTDELARGNSQLQLQKHILDSMSEAVFAVDADNVVVYCNVAAERMYGVPRSEALGQDLSQIYTRKWFSREDEQRLWFDLTRSGNWEGENIHVLRDGTERFTESTVDTLTAGSAGGLVRVIRDVTSRKRAELELRNRAEELVRVNEDLTQFANAVGHDLQSPLRTIASLTELLKRKYSDCPDEETGSIIRTILESAGRVNGMLNDLLQLARVAGEEVAHETVSLETALRDAMRNLSVDVQESASLVTHDSLPEVTGDHSQFVQLFQNLIGNSIKYRKAETVPHIHVSAKLAPLTGQRGEWVISLRDNGIGFEQQFAECIFGVFRRLHKQQYAGTGLGLAICKRVVERHGGRIWAISQVGAGAEFSFSLPVKSAAVPIDG